MPLKKLVAALLERSAPINTLMEFVGNEAFVSVVPSCTPLRKGVSPYELSNTAFATYLFPVLRVVAPTLGVHGAASACSASFELLIPRK